MKIFGFTFALLWSLAIFASAPQTPTYDPVYCCPWENNPEFPVISYNMLNMPGVFGLPQTATFEKGTITSLAWVKDAAGTNIGISFTVELKDTTTTETFQCAYEINGDEFASLPGGAAAKRAAVLAIIKREARATFIAWRDARAARRQPAAPRDPLTDLGVTEVTDFTGAASPTPTPTP